MYKTINDPGIWESKARILYLNSHGVFLRWQVYFLSANLNSFIWKNFQLTKQINQDSVEIFFFSKETIG